MPSLVIGSDPGALRAIACELGDELTATEDRADELSTGLRIAEARMAQLERLIVGYRRRTIRVISLLRDRQKYDPKRLPEWLTAQRAAETAEIARVQRLEGWALNVITCGEIYPDAQPPADWDSISRVTDVITQEIAHG